ncbi:MAG: hypothetical protein FWG96_00045 [Methanomassiliicoccaceae archaeon]|nr:hypothetical protein [Methanomassiliicoccaceae archaeon]
MSRAAWLADLIGEGDAKAAVSFLIISLVKIALVLVLMVLYAYVLLHSFAGSQNISIGVMDMFTAAKNPIILLTPYFLLSVFSGYYYKGTKRRFFFMMVSNTYLMCAILFFSHTFRYKVYDFPINTGYPMSISSISLELDISFIAIMMCAFPVCSMINAYLEYVRNKADAPASF